MLERLHDLPGCTTVEDPWVSVEGLCDGTISVAEPDVPRGIPWSIEHVQAPRLWERGLLGQDVVIAVVDTGVATDHPGLQGTIWRGGYSWNGEGYNAVDRSAHVQDDIGHGTACAGIIAGNGARGVQTGIAPRARVMPVKVFGPHGASQGAIWEGIEWAVRNGADVISLSLSFNIHQNPQAQGWRAIGEFLLAVGVPLICSAGNLGDRKEEFPIPSNIPLPGSVPPPWLHPRQRVNAGGTAAMVTCGAATRADSPLAGSGAGPVTWKDIAPYHDYPYSSEEIGLMKPDLLAPGEDLLSLSHRGHGYIRFGNTSGAVPHVAGCAALLVSAFPRLTPMELTEALEMTALHPTPGMKDNRHGAGRIDVARAYDYLAARS